MVQQESDSQPIITRLVLGPEDIYDLDGNVVYGDGGAGLILTHRSGLEGQHASPQHFSPTRTKREGVEVILPASVVISNNITNPDGSTVVRNVELVAKG